MTWLPSTKTRYAALVLGLLGVLALLDDFAAAVSALGGTGLALLAAACFAVVYGWLLIEPTVQSAMVTGQLQRGETVDRVVAVVADVAARIGVATPAGVCVYESKAFSVTTFGLGERSKIFVSTRAAAIPIAELTAIVAHEYGHLLLRHPHARLAMLGSLLALAMLSTGVPAVALTANLFVLWTMRQMEFRADAVAAKIVGADVVRLALNLARTILGDGPRWHSVFKTHPPISDRIKRLQ